MSEKIIIKNKKAFFNYEILETFEAGVVLLGYEVKSVKNSQITVSDSFIKIDKQEAWLWNANIVQYKDSNIKNYDPIRTRKLLLKKKEIYRIGQKLNTKGLTVVPTKIYLKNGRVKVEIGIGRGKKQYEKKEKIKERDLERELHREKRKYMV